AGIRSGAHFNFHALRDISQPFSVQYSWSWRCHTTSDILPMAASKFWYMRRDSDQFVSARRLLADSPDKYQYATYISGNMRGLAFYVHDPIAVLMSEAKELAMDVTYGTNSAGIDLFTVLAEVDGTGIPLAYCFAEILVSEDGKKQKDPGATTCLLTQFLKPLKTSGFRLTFFRSDKDFSEIGAIKQIWPDTTI